MCALCMWRELKIVVQWFEAKSYKLKTRFFKYLNYELTEHNQLA